MNGNSAPPKGSHFQHHVANLLLGLRQWAALVKAHRKMRAEFAALDQSGVLDDVLRDMNLTRSNLKAVLDADLRAPERLEEMIGRLGLTDRLLGDTGGVLRDVERVCTACQATGVCDRWLHGDRQDGYEEFCPNAPTFAALRAEKS